MLPACLKRCGVDREFVLVFLVELILFELILIEISDIGRAHLLEKLGSDLLD